MYIVRVEFGQSFKSGMTISIPYPNMTFSLRVLLEPKRAKKIYIHLGKFKLVSIKFWLNYHPYSQFVWFILWFVSLTTLNVFNRVCVNIYITTIYGLHHYFNSQYIFMSLCFVSQTCLHLFSFLNIEFILTKHLCFIVSFSFHINHVIILYIIFYSFLERLKAYTLPQLIIFKWKLLIGWNFITKLQHHYHTCSFM